MALGVLKIPLWFITVCLVDFRVRLKCAVSAYNFISPHFFKETVFSCCSILVITQLFNRRRKNFGLSIFFARIEGHFLKQKCWYFKNSLVECREMSDGMKHA